MTGYHNSRQGAVTSLTEYILITGILLMLLVPVMSVVDSIFMQGPADDLRYHSFIDIGNGMSVRIVDLYVIAPPHGAINTTISLPPDVAGDDYLVNATGEKGNQMIEVTGGNIRSEISIAGIGASKAVTGNTTGSGWNVITYNGG